MEHAFGREFPELDAPGEGGPLPACGAVGAALHATLKLELIAADELQPLASVGHTKLPPLPALHCTGTAAEGGGLGSYALAIHCGGCMIDQQKIRARILDLQVRRWGLQVPWGLTIGLLRCCFWCRVIWRLARPGHVAQLACCTHPPATDGSAWPCPTQLRPRRRRASPSPITACCCRMRTRQRLWSGRSSLGALTFRRLRLATEGAPAVPQQPCMLLPTHDR